MTQAHSKQSGITLIELMVAIALFVLVSVVATGLLIRLSNVNNKSQAILTALNNLDYALENMSRTMRTGYDYHCTTGTNPVPPAPVDCPTGNGGTAVSFHDAYGGVLQYGFDPDKKIIYRLKGSSINPVALTAPEVEITNLRFFVVGAERGDNNDQPRVLIILEGQTRIPDFRAEDQAHFSIQTTVSQRQSDLTF